MLRRALLLGALSVACSAPSFTHAPSSPTYRQLRPPPALTDAALQRAPLVAEDSRLRARIPNPVAALHDAVELMASQLGQACTLRPTGPDRLHWTITCAADTLFAPGKSTPLGSPAEQTRIIQQWQAVGRIVGDLAQQTLPGSARLRIAVSGFADHIEIANTEVGECGPLTRFWGATPPPSTQQAAINRALSFCRAANMAKEIACAAVHGRCEGREDVSRTGLEFSVFGGGTVRLDGSEPRFHTRVQGVAGPLECTCHRIAPDVFGPSWANHHGPVEACPEEAAPGAPPVLSDCDDARRVVLDLWLEVTANEVRPSACRSTATNPDSRALVCLQGALHDTAHERIVPVVAATPPSTVRCLAPGQTPGWIEARVGTHAPCVAELPQ